MIRAIIGAALLAAAPAALAQSAMTRDGVVTGTPGADPGFAVYRGIPYAAAPIGPLRWRPPAPPAPWHGTLKADHFAPDCWSARTLPGAAPASEDCLTLNVYTPTTKPGAKLPVMLWIYGGAFSGGTANTPRFDGTGLNRKGVILVTFNYRTSVFGFLAHPALTAESAHHASGNYGVLDAIAALRWVHANIAAFGGDPNNVTLFGQSSGSQTVQLTTLSPLSRGLIAKAIGESGAGFGEREPFALATAEASGTAYAAAFGNSLAAMRAASAEQLVAAIQNRKFEPIVDGWVIPADPHAIYAAHRAPDLPTMVGANGDEGQLSTTLTLAAYVAGVRQRYGANADRMLALYPANNDDEARAASKAMNTLVLGDFNVGGWADGQARAGTAPVWQYRFVHTAPSGPPGPFGPASKGAYHGAEIPYAFNNFSADRVWTDTDHALQADLSTYWTNFAKTGDPNTPDRLDGALPHWSRLDLANPRVLVIGDTPAMAPRSYGAERAKVEAIFYGPGGVFAAPATGAGQ